MQDQLLTSLTSSRGNTIQALPDATTTYRDMIASIQNSQHLIMFTNYWMEEGQAWNKIYKALLGAAQRGVKLYILADAQGSHGVPQRYIEQLRAAGALWTVFQPFQWLYPWRYNKRLHKKLLIIDGEIGYTGGVNIRDSWITAYHHFPIAWRDTHFRLKGPIVLEMIRSFTNSWQQWSSIKLPKPTPGTRMPTTSGVRAAAVESLPHAGNITPAGKLYIELINAAKREVLITSAYAGPPKALRIALIQAARRGVSIHLLINGPYSTHAYAVEAGRRWYAQLLRVGINIYEYQPTMIHAKLMMVDGRYSTIGSANLNFRSFFHDQEFNILIDNQSFTSKLAAQFRQDITLTERISPESWRKRGMQQVIWQYLCSLGRYFF